MKPTVYIETTIIGHLTSRVPQDPLVAGQMVATRKWWDESRQQFELLTSDVVRSECSHGDPQAASERLERIATLEMVQVPSEIESFVDLLLSRHALPAKARVDAYHVAIAAMNFIEYLLTWNCRHLANATMRVRIEETCQERGYAAPIICTPYELMEVRDV